MSRVGEERVKLLANALSNAGVGCLTAGVITTLGALVLDLPGTRERYGIIALVSVIWLLAALNLHLMGQLVLGRLKDDGP